MSTGDQEDERRAAHRASGRAVAAALLGYTLRRVCVLPDHDESGTTHPQAVMALKERDVTVEEKAFIDLAGTWAELDGVDFSSEPETARARILSTFQQMYPNIDANRTQYGLRKLIDDYRSAVRALAQELSHRKDMSGVDCGKIIMAHRTSV